MMWRDVVDLLTVTININGLGDPVETKSARQVYVNKKDIRQSEFYQAQATGLRPELMFEVRSIEYHGEPILRFANKEYTIIRTHSKNHEITELICQGLVI